jgi:ankyrin repeat protein
MRTKYSLYKFGRTPLHWAAYNDHSNIVKLLLAYEVDDTIEDKEGLTAYELAKVRKSHKCISTFKKSAK